MTMKPNGGPAFPVPNMEQYAGFNGMTDIKPSAPQPPTMHTKHVAASVSDMVQEWYSGKSDVPHMTADIFERRISRFQSLEPAQPDPLGAAWMREQAAHTVCINAWAHQGTDAYSKGMDAGARHQNEVDIAAIRAIPDPTPADRLAQAMKLPEVAALVEALERIAHASDFYGVEANAEDQGAGTLAYAHKSTCNLARAALAEGTPT